MGKEIETKILEVDKDAVAKILTDLGAEQIQDTLLTVDWFRPKGVKDGEDPWYLRIRTTAAGSSEVTWKSKPVAVGISKQVHEINLKIEDPAAAAEMFAAIGLEQYAHQEKYRASWKLNDLRFDLDQYPDMPAYLEIEGESEDRLHEGIRLLGLEKHRAVAEGERILIQNEYKLNWHEMRF